MLIRVNMPGVPDANDVTRWPFPTAGLYSYDPVTGTAIFDVPDTDAPDNPSAPGGPDRPNTPAGPVIISMTAGQLATFKAKLTARYAGNQRIQGLNVR